MTFGDRLSALRRASQHTQEQLAELLEVTRQSVSRWESGLAYPETEKLIRIASLYGVTVDYLLTGKDSPAERQHPSRRWHYEYVSRRKIGNLPLVHINIGIGFYRAKGFFAVGNLSAGVFSAGLLSAGLFSAGILSLGLLALGYLCLGVFAAGTVAAGLIALGAIAVGVFSMGAVSLGGFSFGALAIGKYFAMGDYAAAEIALGVTHAEGALYASASGVKNTYAFDFAAVSRLLNESVPAVWRMFADWALAICRGAA